MRRIAALLLFAFAAPAAVALPLGTATLSTSGPDCSGATLLTTSQCLRATVDVPNGTVDGVSTAVATITADVKITNPSGTVIGTIVCFSGAAGNSWYEALNNVVTNWMNAAVARNQRIIQVRWNGSGWLAGSVGALTLSARGATLLQAIHDNANGFTLYTAGTPFIAVGHSAGSSLVAFGLGHYGMRDILDLAVFSSGPPHARQDYICHGTGMPAWNTTGTPLITAGAGVIKATGAEASIHDASYGAGTPCASASMAGGRNNPGYAHSILTGGVTLNYPRTTIRAVYGDGDVSAAVPIGRHWLSQVTSTKTENITTGGWTHGDVPGSASGAAFIDAALAAARFNH